MWADSTFLLSLVGSTGDSEDDNAFLTAMPDEDEIKSTVFEKDVPRSRWLPRKLLSNLLAYHRQRHLQGDPLLPVKAQ
ncbi:hypothetical protein LIER_14129 [Lithospermum erythrorhizon]|uniref:Uncharacterized protein n=1 Tax=Lithospermum erythrorhizon TaxID=34254 RepID=A0AAV3PZ00_LITER